MSNDDFRIRLKHLHIGTDNLLDIDPAVLAAAKKPESIRVKQGMVILDGIPMSTSNHERKLYVYKADLDALGYTFVGDLLKLVNKGFVHRGKTYDQPVKGCSGYTQMKAPSKPLKQEDLAQFNSFLIPCDYLFSILGAGKTKKEKQI